MTYAEVLETIESWKKCFVAMSVWGLKDEAALSSLNELSNESKRAKDEHILTIKYMASDYNCLVTENSDLKSELDRARKVADEVLKWWEEHQYDSTGDYGEYNVYGSEPDFVTAAINYLTELNGKP